MPDDLRLGDLRELGRLAPQESVWDQLVERLLRHVGGGQLRGAPPLDRALENRRRRIPLQRRAAVHGLGRRPSHEVTPSLTF
jgi:hypothetical protein